jgi:uncharacterized membrane protein YdbT with pleckstrin-like domain
VAFPRRLLFEGEEVVLDLRPHWWFFAGPAALLVASLVALVAVAVQDVGDWALLAGAGVVIAALLWFAGRYVRWMTTNFVLTSDRLIYRSGVVSKRGIEIPLERINTVFLAQNPFERLLRSGDLVIESGGETGRESFADIANPGNVQNEIYRQIELNQRRMVGGTATEQRAPDAVDQLHRLDELRQRGVITDAEFQAKKAKLLDSI